MDEEGLQNYLGRYLRGMYGDEVEIEWKLDGWDHVAGVVNDRVYRVARKIEYRMNDAMEAAFCAEFAEQCSIPISVPRLVSGEDWAIYEMDKMRGKPLTKEAYKQMSEERKENVMSQMVRFLSALHDFPLDKAAKLGVKKYDVVEDWRETYAKIQKVVFPVVSAEVQEVIRDRFDDFFELAAEYEIPYGVIHGDFAPEHIWVTDDGDVGVIDFADMHIFDPAYDLQVAYCYKQTFLDYFYEHYEVDEKFEERRAFYEFTRRTRKVRHSILRESDQLEVHIRQLEEECGLG